MVHPDHGSHKEVLEGESMHGTSTPRGAGLQNILDGMKAVYGNIQSPEKVRETL